MQSVLPRRRSPLLALPLSSPLRTRNAIGTFDDVLADIRRKKLVTHNSVDHRIDVALG